MPIVNKHMPLDDFFWRRAIVFAGALIYWGGVVILARRVRKRIGRSPNLKPRTAKERLLWLGWTLVVLTWMLQPLFVRVGHGWAGFQIHSACLVPGGFLAGVALTLIGYAATLWCYVVMGHAWRVGVNREERNALITAGPFRWIRHPIYALQTLMLLGALLLLPTAASAVAVTLHVVCALLKARDEEAYLISVHGDAYRALMARTWRLLPKFW